MRKKIARGAIVACLGLATVAFGASEKRVIVKVDGVPVAVRTHAATVSDALQRAGVEFGSLDRVEPAPVETIASGDVIEVYRAKSVVLLLDGRPQRVVVTGTTVAEVLDEVDLRHRRLDAVSPSRDAAIEPGMTIRYDRAVSLTVVADGERERVITNAATVSKVLQDLGITVRTRDLVRPRLSAPLEEGMTIRVLRIGFRRVVSTVQISYETVLRRDPNLEYGQRRVIQEGREGVRRLVHRIRYVDGEPASRELISSTVTRAPQTRIIAVGSGYPGCVCNKGTQSGKASWYHRDDGLTAAHRTLPFGTVVRVENQANGKWVNVRIVDRGPFIEGRIIDLSDEAFRRLASLSTGVIDVRIRW